jgi:ribonuclease G
MPSLSTLARGKEAFLHYTDLGEKFSSFRGFFGRLVQKANEQIERFHVLPEYLKEGKIGEVLSVNDYLAVQILKEPMSSKGARLSADLSLAGRFFGIDTLHAPV